MKRHITNIIKYAGGIFLMLSSSIVIAQDYSDCSPAALEILKTKRMWHETSNAAGLLFDNTPQYSEVNLGYQWQNGNYHRPQQGKSENSVKVNAEGGMKLGEASVWGLFSFSRDAINDANYNASIIDPFRGMPYYVADTNPSDWRNQHYKLQFKAAYPLFQSLSIGMEGEYRASLGAKQRDPRTENRQFTLVLKPGIVYSLNDKHKIGANFEYYSLKEESNMTNVNHQVDQTYYALYGLGTAVIGLGSGRTTNYVGNNIGGAIQYNYRGDVNILLEGKYNVKVEDVEISFTSPKDDSSVKDKNWSGKAMFYQESRNFLNTLTLQYINRHIDGIQYITQRDNTSSYQGWMSLYSNIRSTYKTQDWSAAYSLKAKRNDEYKWMIDAGVDYMKQNDTYLIPYSIMNYENLKFNAGGKINFRLSDKMFKRLLVGAHFTYNTNLSGTYDYNGSHADYPTVTDFEQNDFNYLTSDYYGINISAVYSQKYSDRSKGNIYLKGLFNYVKTNASQYGHRSYAEFTFGCNF